jgi:hypothetical protein
MTLPMKIPEVLLCLFSVGLQGLWPLPRCTGRRGVLVNQLITSLVPGMAKSVLNLTNPPNDGASANRFQEKEQGGQTD